MLLLSGALVSAWAAETPLPDAIAAAGETVVLSVHAEGAQVYECKAGADGKPGWVFREPIATLLPRLRAEGVRPVSSNGVLGDPTGASAEEGRVLLDGLVHDLAAAVSAQWSTTAAFT